MTTEGRMTYAEYCKLLEKQSVVPSPVESDITLTAAQKEAVKIIGISEAEYIAQIRKLRATKLRGRYGG